jgi:hypothetical protein
MPSPDRSAKDIIVTPISSADARRIVRAIHYSGKVANNSTVHLGVFLDGKCGGALQFGSPMVRRKLIWLVKGTLWNEFLELNRMALADWLPRNSESRAIAMSLRWIKKQYPWLKWVISFADATQCGDGAIYRASGFVLTAIKRNSTILKMPDGAIVADLTLNTSGGKGILNHLILGIERKTGWWKRHGAKALPGFQLRYIYFLHPAERQNLTVPVIPFSDIERLGAKMYRGKAPEVKQVDTPGVHPGEGGAVPTPALQKVPLKTIPIS